MVTAPGPTPDRAAAELAEELSIARIDLTECQTSRRILQEIEQGLRAELDRQRGWIAELERRVDDGDDAMVKLGRMSVELSGCIAENQRLYAERDDLIMENRRIRGEASRWGNELDRQRDLIAAVLAACSEAEAVAGWNTARVTVAEIRALLEGEGQ